MRSFTDTVTSVVTSRNPTTRLTAPRITAASTTIHQRTHPVKNALERSPRRTTERLSNTPSSSRGHLWAPKSGSDAACRAREMRRYLGTPEFQAEFAAARNDALNDDPDAADFVFPITDNRSLPIRFG